MHARLTRSTAARPGFTPGLAGLRGYRRDWLRGDVLGGVTVAAYLVPQVMAYASVAGLPPTAGLSAALPALTTVAVLLLGVLAGIAAAVGLSILDLLRRVARGHDGILGFVPGLAGMHDVDDHPDAATVEGLVVYRYDSPLFFANAEDFRTRCLDAVAAAEQPVTWLVLNMEADVEVDLTALDALDELRRTLAAQDVVVALARVKDDLRHDLDRFGLTEALGQDLLFPTLPTAVVAYTRDFEARRGRRPVGAPG